MTHARLSPSSSKRWLSCLPSGNPASWIPGFKPIEDSSAASEEGTAAHAVAEAILKYPNIVEEVMPYVNYINKKRKVEGIEEIEAHLDISEYATECFGSADYLRYTPSNKQLHIVDLKFGRYPVLPEKNTQMLLYALGAYEKLKGEHTIESIKLTIAQVRRDSISSWVISKNDLLKFGEAVKKLAPVAFKGKGKHNPTQDNCFFCPAKSLCKYVYSDTEWLKD